MAASHRSHALSSRESGTEEARRARYAALKRAKKHPLPKPRNPVARSPLLGKGGAHGKSNAARRRQAKVDLQKIVRENEGG